MFDCSKIVTWNDAVVMLSLVTETVFVQKREQEVYGADGDTYEANKETDLFSDEKFFIRKVYQNQSAKQLGNG